MTDTKIGVRPTSTEIPRIEGIEISLARVPLPQGPWGDQIHKVTDIEVTVVDLHADNGLVGTGFSHTSGMGARTIGALAAEIAPVLAGERVSPRALWNRAYRYVHDIGGAGVTTHALSAFDIAAWDLLGKTLGANVVDLIGRVRDSVPLYGSGINLNLSAEEVVEQVRRWRAEGYAAAKVKVGKPDLEEDVERLAKIREAVGAFPVAVDANQGWSYPQAVRAFSRFEQFDLLWVEEPLPADDIPGHVRLAREVRTPIGLGENVYTVDQFVQYFDGGAVDFVQADLGRVGGITGYLDIAAAARTRNLPMTPHFVMELSASILAAIPNISYAEMTDGGTWTDLGIFASTGQTRNGRYLPPTGPGHGLVLDRDYLTEHRI
ncbi:mandelate racemase/muconate lactonizing enzyme family protein [Microbacterium sp. KR10-403]|uniref:mandelate racemase/muconate lactonizing enzyme family protein n=1 Tax=Microbacterium sp. KR10-403 TaxID=3158581 RepID=UPI0032E465DD